MELFTNILVDFSLAFCVAACWGILFGAPSRSLWMTGLLGGFGHCIRFVLLHVGLGLIASTLTASVMIGLVGIYAAHIVHDPPVVITMPACITMIPGLYAYRSMLGIIKLADQSTLDANPTLLRTIAHNIVLSFSLLFTLAVGISISALLFRNKSVKEIRFRQKN
jgi:uncharacterized membrane protein YjjB (DUF3815 family)